MVDFSNAHYAYRHSHKGGVVYLAVEGFLWILSATLGAMGQIPAAMLALVIGGMFIHPLATACSRLFRMPRPDNANRLAVLNTWLALTIPLGLPLIFMATSSGRTNMFFPAFSVLVGAHWLPFTYVYSMKSFAFLGGILVSAGILFGFVFTQSFAACGFVTGGVLLVFALIHIVIVGREPSTALGLGKTNCEHPGIDPGHPIANMS